LGESQIIDSASADTPFDKWLYKNYTLPYNIDFQYKLKDKETDLNYNVVPADIDKSKAMAKLVKFLFLETLEEARGLEFTKTYCPKSILLVGSALYKSTSYVTGYAEGGMKIAFTDVNSMNINNITFDYLTDKYMKTAFHEFSHILHQTKKYPDEFANLTATTYIGDDWSSSTALTADSANILGYVSAYARSEPNEDFADLIAIYVTRGQANWERILTKGSTYSNGGAASGKAFLEQKLQIVREYLMGTWQIDIDELRAIFESRGGRINELDYTNF